MASIADRIGIRDKRCIKAFVDGRPCDGYKLSTDGQTLDGMWIGGRGIAERHADGSITFGDLGSRSTQTVQRAVIRAMGGSKRR